MDQQTRNLGNRNEGCGLRERLLVESGGASVDDNDEDEDDSDEKEEDDDDEDDEWRRRRTKTRTTRTRTTTTNSADEFHHDIDLAPELHIL